MATTVGALMTPLAALIQTFVPLIWVNDLNVDNKEESKVKIFNYLLV